MAAVTSRRFRFLLLLLVGAAVRCYGDGGRADHLLLLERLPEGVSDRPGFLDVRTNFSGTVRLMESSEFRVVVNISAPDLQAAYKVKPELKAQDDGLLLQVSEQELTAGVVTLTWLGVCVAGLTALVLVLSSLYACCWYRQERSLYDLAEKKSVAGSSQRGVYRSRNSLQVVNLPPLGDLPILPSDRDEMEGPQNDDSLKQVPEMPEEEEAEAIEMEELTLLKLKDVVDGSHDPRANESDAHRLTPQERNLIKSQLHAHPKSVHKDLLKKDKPFKNPPVKDKPTKQPPRRRTATGLYTGVASGPEIVPGSADESMDSETDADLDSEIIWELKKPQEPNYENTQQDHTRGLGMGGGASFLSSQRAARQGHGMKVASPGAGGGDLPYSKASPVKGEGGGGGSSAMDLDSGLQVLADVHKVGSTQPEIVRVTTPDKQTHPGFGGGLMSPDATRPTLTTFNSPAQMPPPPPPPPPHAHGPSSASKTLRFKEPEEVSERSGLPPPPVAPKPPAASVAGRPLPGYPAMGGIPEDPREDCESVQSGSARSRSLYGSSEIFDANNPMHTYYNLEDSDIDIPPLDAEDFFSDGGLPSPLTASLGRGSRTQDDSSLTGQRFFSAPKPRPNSSIIPRADLGHHSGNHPSNNNQSNNRTGGSDSGVSSGISSDQTSTPVNSEESPNLPPPPLPPQEELSQDGSAFNFPPPPSYFSLQHPERPPPNPRASVGEYVTLPNNSTKGGPPPPPRPASRQPSNAANRGGGGGGGGGRLGFGSKFTHLTILSLACLLALTTSGVYAKVRGLGDQLDPETRVDITIFAPLKFLTSKNTTVYFNRNRDAEVAAQGSFKVKTFVMEDPVLRSDRKLPCSASCEHGCDTQTGQCICHKGYRLIDHYNCMDVNECAEGFTRCHRHAGCLNTKGSYTCVCTGDYYGDGKTCQDCNTPCREDQYEEQNCSKIDDKIYEKICKDCTMSCPKGYYMASQCTETANARCRVCQPPCMEGEYEYRTCSNFHDRQCKNVSTLPALETSDNLMVEEDRMVEGSEVTIEHLPNLAIGYTRYSLNRGTGLHVDISIQTLEAAQQFVPLDLHNVSMPGAAPSLLYSHAVQRFCPYPVPDHYILHYTKHQGVTYQLDEQGEIAKCHTFKDYGTFPNITARKDNSFLCREPGSLTKLFEIPPEIFQTSTLWAERSKRCATHVDKCEQCTRKCAQQMVGGSNSDCAITGDDNDNGWSPRLQVCYNCCARSNCSDDCRHYHKRRCQPLKCHVGSLVEFQVFPAWASSHQGKFFCHIEPRPRQRLLQMKYTVRSNARKDPIHTSTLTVDGGEEWEKTGRFVYRDKLLNIVIDSQLRKLPDFLEGRFSADSGAFHVGSYVTEGSRVESAVVSGESIRINPIKPFGIRINRSDPQKCESDILKESLISGQRPYTPDHELTARAFQNSSTPFIITRTHHPPTLTITADRHRSFLKAIFPPTTLTAGSLTGRMTQNSTHWLVEVMGSVGTCPGYLKVVLSDPAYRHTRLFSADVAVTCPRTFHLRFQLPSADARGLNRQVVASVADELQVHHLRLHRPAPPTVHVSGETRGKDAAAATDAAPQLVPAAAAEMPGGRGGGQGSEDEGVREEEEGSELPEGFIFSIPFVVSVGGAIFLLLCLLVIGLIVQPGVPAPEVPILRCHHALFMVIYVVFQFIYSIVATSTVFFLVVIAVNSPRVAFIRQHQEQSAAASATHQLELTAMQSFLQTELTRQDTHMDSMRGLCQTDMQHIIADMNKLHSGVLRETEDVFQRHKLEVLLEEHRHRSMQQLSQDLLSFRAKYSQAVRTMLLELNHNVQQAHNSIHNNSWLAGARFLHGVISTMREHLSNVDSKPFLEWAHLQHDISKLIVDVSFSLPSLPRLSDIEEVIEAEAEKKPSSSKRRSGRKSKDLNEEDDHLHTTHVYNQWFSPFTHHNGTTASSSSASHDGLQFQAGSDGGNEDGAGGSLRMFSVFLVVLICLDVLLVLHRMLKAKIGGQLLLYGYPEYMDFRERKDDGDDDVFDDNRKCRSCSDTPCCQAMKLFVSQVLNSSFVPKAMVVLVTVLLLRGLLHVSSTMLTVKALHRAGLYHSSEDYLDLHSQLINGRLKAHAHHINTVDFPAYQTWMSAYIQRHHFAFQVYQQQLQRMQRVHMQSYCHYLQSLGLSGNCSHNATGATNEGHDSSSTMNGVISPACQFQPVIPKLYKRSESAYQNLLEQQLRVLLENIRAIIFDTCQVVVVFLSIIVLKELLCAVVWIFIRRSGLIRLRIIYETDQDDPSPSG